MDQGLYTRVINRVIRTGMLRTSFVLALATLPLFAGLLTLAGIAIFGNAHSWENAAWLWSFPANNAWIFLVLLMLAMGLGNFTWEVPSKRRMDSFTSVIIATLVADGITHFHRFCENQANLTASETGVTSTAFLLGAAVAGMTMGIVSRLIDSLNERVTSFLDSALRRW